MYVRLGEHAKLLPLFEEEFKIVNETQIVNIIDKGITLIDVDTAKSEVEVPLPEGFDPVSKIGEALRHTIEDEKAAPEEKATAVYDHSIKMMQSLLTEPSKENILSGKAMISDMVSAIMEQDSLASALSKITSHDYYTYTHSVNVGMMGVLLAKEVYGDRSEQNLNELGAGFFLHDLGKCEVPAFLINKPGRLTDEEWEMMRKHPSFGEKILHDTGTMTAECEFIVGQHHEREDGSGYPRGLSSSEIHDYARICSVVDVYDALSSERAYKKALSPFESLKIMKEEMIHHFHKEVFEKFVMIFTH